MPVQAGLLAQAGQGYLAGAANVARTLAEYNSQTGYAQGLLAGIQKRQQDRQLDLTQQDLTFRMAAKNKEIDLEQRKFDHLVDNDADQLEIERQRLSLAQRQTELADLRDQQRIALTARGLDIQESQGNRGLDIQEKSADIDALYKQSLMAVNQFSMSPDNPENLMKLAQASIAMKSLSSPAEPLSNEGKIAYDLKTGAVTPEFLNSMETSYDPATGQRTARFNLPQGQGNGQANGITPKAMEDLQKQDNAFLTDLRKEVTTGVKEVGDFENLGKYFENFGATGPILGKLKLYGAQLGSILGVPGAQQVAASGEAIQSAASKVALLARKDMPGQLSDKDREFLLGIAPSLDKTRKGNELIVEAAKARVSLMKQYLYFAETYRRQNGTLNGMEQAWGTYTTNNPIFNKTQDGNVTVTQPKVENVDRFFSKKTLDMNSPEVKSALAKGYTLEQIKAVM